MSKPNKRRKSTSGQYVSPQINELEWLDEEVEVKPASAKKNMKNRKSASKIKAKVKKKGPTAKIKVIDSIPNHAYSSEASDSAKSRYSAPPAPPLLLLNKSKPRYPRSAWVKDLLGIDPWAITNDDTIASAIDKFQKGLDNILQPKRPVVIDVESEVKDKSENQPEAKLNTEEVMEKRELQQYGLIPFVLEQSNLWLDIAITYEQPFADLQYAFVATTDIEGCRTVIVHKEPGQIFVRIIRESSQPRLQGQLNWIAIGHRAQVPSFV
ncbi:WIAG-tail domain [Paenibacillus chartarius]|uniref:WIAG-tail domain n=1 Tax=Paenibacillus chartarius TaxID=747481 RepID=A0ABV6DJ92_9BACL